MQYYQQYRTGSGKDMGITNGNLNGNNSLAKPGTESLGMGGNGI